MLRKVWDIARLSLPEIPSERRHSVAAGIGSHLQTSASSVKGFQYFGPPPTVVSHGDLHIRDLGRTLFIGVPLSVGSSYAGAIEVLPLLSTIRSLDQARTSSQAVCLQNSAS